MFLSVVDGSRLIPAHAGKTDGGRVRSRVRAAHPRSRGENEALRASSDALMGSSPLTRGKHRRVGDPHQPLGLIPAHAGKTPGRPRRPTLGAAHPRSRGENNARRGMRYRGAGSSPLTRGKLRRNVWRMILPRLIPAHAGKTQGQPGGLPDRQAHPRSRGENELVDVSAGGNEGSSPLTRGKRTTRIQRPRHRRLIPAHAGKTWGSWRLS